MEGKSVHKSLLLTLKPYIAMVLLQFSFAVMYVTSLATLKKGMDLSVLFVYRGLVAAVLFAPFAFLLERKGRPKVTRVIFIRVMALAILQPVLDQNFYFMGAKNTSAGFASALENVNPAITFVICLFLRVERLNIQRRYGIAKIIGALLGVTGAVLMILYKGPFVEFFWTEGRESHGPTKNSNTDANNNLTWIKGTLMVLVGCCSWCSFLILQTNTLKVYPAKLSLTVMVCCFGAVINTMIALVRNPSSIQPWILGWDMRLFVVIYSGVLCTGVMHYVLGIVMKEKGPVFASAFNPLTMMMTAVLSSFVLAERIALGTSGYFVPNGWSENAAIYLFFKWSFLAALRRIPPRIIGAIVVIAGLYLILWGKSNETRVRTEKETDIDGLKLPVIRPNCVEESPTLRSESLSIIEIHKIEEKVQT